MNAGTGCLNTSRKQDPSGAPFAANAADNGVSVDPVSGRIVLGDDGVTGLGQFLNDRFLSTLGFLLQIFGALGTVSIREALIHIEGDGANAAVAELRLEDFAQPQHIGTIFFDHTNARLIIEYANGVPQSTSINVRSSGVNVSNPGQGAAVTGALFEVTDGAIATQQPSANGPGEWRLGTVQNAAVALDNTRFVEVSIGGVVVQLAVVV